MNSLGRFGVAVIATLPLWACAPKPIFYWGDYETSIHDRWVKNNAGQSDEHLGTSIANAQQAGGKVPPGLFADYGFMLYRRGNYDGAIEYFDKERKTFPESSLLMGKLIDKVREKQSPKPVSEPAQPQEGEKQP